MELLKQPLGNPMSLSQQVVTLVGAIGKKFVGVPIGELKDYQRRLLEYFGDYQSDIMSEIETLKQLDGELKDKILKAIDEFNAKK